MQSDLIIIGAGPGGYECAVRAAREGLQVVVIERGEPGGTCLNAGCIPTKCLCRSAEALDEACEAGAYGVTLAAPPAFSLATAVARKDAVVQQLRDGIRALMRTPGITYVSGEARFVNATTLAVGGEQYTAPHVIIATGSVTRRLPIPGADLPGVLTSTEMLQCTEVPQRLCVVGGGVIGLEFASVFRSFGSEVTVVEYAKEVLQPAFDRDTAKRLRTELKRRGIAFHTGAAVTAIEREGEGSALTVCYTEKEKPARLQTDLVLMAVGRSANRSALNLDDVGIATTPRGITVDEQMQTSVPGIYAVGDVNGRCQLAHAATFQSYRALNHILGRDDALRLDLIPAAVFTQPEVAMVGLTEEQAAAQGIAYTLHRSTYRANGRALSMGTPAGQVKLLVDATDHIIGAHIIGAHAADLVHELAVAMASHTTRAALAGVVHAHPSLAEIVLAAAAE